MQIVLYNKTTYLSKLIFFSQKITFNARLIISIYKQLIIRWSKIIFIIQIFFPHRTQLILMGLTILLFLLEII